MDGADVGAEAWCVGVFGDGDADLDVVCRAAAFKLRFGLERGSVFCADWTLESASYVERQWQKTGWPAYLTKGEHTLSIYSIRLPECDSTMHSTQISGFTCVFNR